MLKKLAAYAPVSVAKTSHQSSNKKQKTGQKKSSSQFSSSSSVEVSDSASEGSASSKVGNSVSQAARLPSSTSKHDDVGPHPYAPNELINEKGMVCSYVLLEIGIDIPGDPDDQYKVRYEWLDLLNDYFQNPERYDHGDEDEETDGVSSVQEPHSDPMDDNPLDSPAESSKPPFKKRKPSHSPSKDANSFFEEEAFESDGDDDQ